MAAVVGVISYYASFHKVDLPKKEKLCDYENSAKLIEYRVNIKDGNILIRAEKATMQNLNTIMLTNMEALYKTKTRNAKIYSKKCLFSSNESKAYLTDHVIVESDGMTIETDSATIDGKAQSIYGNSKINVVKNGTKFSAVGFSIKEGGKILLKHAKIIKDRK